jgi:endonuclease/exonuclease/phosphatase (EEP) superfamily protein YafD
MYLASVVGFALLLRFAGESWWWTTVALYLPRVPLAIPLPFVVALLWFARSFRILAAQAITALVIAFPVMGLTVPTPSFASASAPRFRVLSYNINSAQGGPESLAVEVDRYAPDVVFMQEIGDVAELERVMKTRYPTVEVDTQFLMATRFPVVSEVDPGKLPVDGRMRSPRFVERTLDTPVGPVTFFNVHPASPREALYAVRGNSLRREILSGHIFSGAASPTIQANVDLRLAQAQAIAEDVAQQQGPVVIAGDTNLPGLSAIFHRHLSRFHDGFSEAGWGLGYTYPNYGATRRWPWPWMRIDRVLTNDALRFASFQVCRTTASDHLCVVADIQRR